MKKFAIFAPALLVAACSEAPEAEPVNVDETVAVEDTAAVDPAMWSSTEEAAGTYGLVYGDGTEGTLTVGGDGSASGVIGGEEFTATASITEAGKICYTELNNEALPVPAQCWVNSAANEDGTWTATGDDGTIATVTPAA